MLAPSSPASRSVSPLVHTPILGKQQPVGTCTSESLQTEEDGWAETSVQLSGQFMLFLLSGSGCLHTAQRQRLRDQGPTHCQGCTNYRGQARCNQPGHRARVLGEQTGTSSECNVELAKNKLKLFGSRTCEVLKKEMLLVWSTALVVSKYG